MRKWITFIIGGFPSPLGISNVHDLLPDSKPYLVVKIIDI
jgi:hypothetical protein